MERHGLDERRGMAAIGALLVVVGVAFLLARQLNVDLAELGWPLFVIVPGVILFAVALSTGGSAGAGLAVPAGIVTMTGIVLAVQNATGLWATWAYAWALVAPGGAGVGLLLYGLLTRQPDLVRGGATTTLVGLGLFVGFAFFFEAVIGLSGARLAGLDVLFAAALVLLGGAIVAASLLGGRRRA